MNYTPSSFVEKLTSKELRNAHELSLKLNISDEDAKKPLKGFGYRWGKHLTLYIKTDKTVEIIKAIMRKELIGDEFLGDTYMTEELFRSIFCDWNTSYTFVFIGSSHCSTITIRATRKMIKQTNY